MSGWPWNLFGRKKKEQQQKPDSRQENKVTINSNLEIVVVTEHPDVKEKEVQIKECAKDLYNMGLELRMIGANLTFNMGMPYIVYIELSDEKMIINFI